MKDFIPPYNFKLSQFLGCKKCIKTWEVSFPPFLCIWETPEMLTFIIWVISWIWLCTANTEQPGLWARWAARLNWRLIISCPSVVCKHSEKASPPSCEGPKGSLLNTVLIFGQLKAKQPPSLTEFGANINSSQTLLFCLPPKTRRTAALVAVASVTPTCDISGMELCSLPLPSLGSPSAMGQTSCCCPAGPKQRAY